MRTRKPMYHAVTSSCRQRSRPGYMSLTFQRYIQIQATLAVVPGCSRHGGMREKNNRAGASLYLLYSDHWNQLVLLEALCPRVDSLLVDTVGPELATGGTISWRQGAELHSRIYQHTRNTGVMTVVILALCREREKAGLQGRWSSEAIVSHSWLIPGCTSQHVCVCTSTTTDALASLTPAPPHVPKWVAVESEVIYVASRSRKGSKCDDLTSI